MQAQVIHIERKCRLKTKPLFHLGFMTVTISIMDVLQLFLWISFAVAKTQQECVEHDLGIASRLTDDDSLHKSLLFWIYREEKDVLNDLETKFRCYSRHHESCLLSSKHIGWVGPRIFNINLSARNLNGTMPSSLGNLTHLEHLDLSHNNLEGSLPDLSRLTMLKTLNLQNNKLNGILPDWLGQLTGLKVLLIQNNDFSGEIPCQLHYGSKLTLNFSGNPLLRLPKECHIDSFLTWATKTVVFSWELISFILTLILVFLGGIILLRWKNATHNLSTGLFLPEKENVNITKAIAEEVSKDSNVVNNENESSEIQLIYGSHAGANIGDVRENDEILLKDMNVHNDNNMGEESMSMDTIRPSSIQMRHENIQAENETQLDNKIKVECIDMSTKAENELFSRNSYEIEDAQMVLETENGISTTNITEAENIQNMISFSNNIELEDIHMLEESDYQILSSTNVEGVESVTTQDEISSSSSIDVEEIQMPTQEQNEITQEQNEIPSGNNIEIEKIQAQDEISFTKEAAPTWASKEDSSIAKVTIGSKPQAFTTEEIFKVTENFSSKIGEGGFGSVYMGTVEDGQKVAVKVLSAFSNQGKQEFLNELELLCHVNHKYLVSLIGYNSENAELMLIYQYMPGGSLNDRLYGPKSEGKELSWRERLRIALDVAHGLDYLHGGCNTKFIHRDIKTANILLDSKLRGKLADFGLAKGTMDHEVSHITTIVKGTPGYLDPEYFKTQMLTDKSDIYSFGVVLLEILFGRQAVNSKLPQNQVNLVRWAMPYLEMKQQRGLIKAIDKKLIGRFSNIKSIRRVAKVAMACVHEDPSWRPGVGDVIWDLKQAIQDEDKPNTQVTSSYIAMLSVNGVRNLTTFFSSRRKKADIHIDQKGEGADGSMLRKFKIEDINKATQKFSKKIGEGGFGKVYKGVMKDGSIIAVKVLSEKSHQGLQEFQNELELLSHVNHKNLVSLLGYCFSESQNPMLVYEYMSGGSLASHLYNKSTENDLKWIELVQIALDIAQGLEYLHGGCNTKLIHRDVKTSNILLDDNLRGKLADFGLSKCFENSCVSHVSTMVKGTMGYIDPEYYQHGRLTEKSDIYAFGVVLLEIICHRKPIMLNEPDETISLLTYVKDRVRLENPETITHIIDSRLARTTLNIKSVVCATKLALACIETEKSHRPSATQVVKQLLEAIEVEKSPRYSALDGDAIKRGESANLPTAEEIASSYNGIYEADRIFCRSLNSITEYE